MLVEASGKWYKMGMSDDVKYTPQFSSGPWHYSRTKRFVGPGLSAPWVCEVSQDVGATFSANAALIAASPSLFAVVWRLVRYVEKSDLDDLDFGRGFGKSGILQEAIAALELTIPQPSKVTA